MANRRARLESLFSTLPSENLFFKARHSEIKVYKHSSSASVTLEGEVYLSPTRMLFLENKLQRDTDISLSIPLELIYDERVVVTDNHKDHLAFVVAADDPQFISVAGRYEIVMTPSTLAKVFYLLLHYLFNLRYGPTYAYQDTHLDERQSVCCAGDCCVESSPEAHPVSSLPSCSSSSSADTDSTPQSSRATEVPIQESQQPTMTEDRVSSGETTSRRKGSPCVRQPFVDLSTAEVYEVDMPYVPQRKAFLDPSTGTVYLYEEAVDPAVFAEKKPRRRFDIQSMRKTLKDFKLLCSRL